jgi:hypothetical protein
MVFNVRSCPALQSYLLNAINMTLNRLFDADVDGKDSRSAQFDTPSPTEPQSQPPSHSWQTPPPLVPAPSRIHKRFKPVRRLPAISEALLKVFEQRNVLAEPSAANVAPSAGSRSFSPPTPRALKFNSLSVGQVYH